MHHPIAKLSELQTTGTGHARLYSVTDSESPRNDTILPPLIGQQACPIIEIKLPPGQLFTKEYCYFGLVKLLTGLTD